jgi:hypothetical protein
MPQSTDKQIDYNKIPKTRLSDNVVGATIDEQEFRRKSDALTRSVTFTKTEMGMYHAGNNTYYGIIKLG